MVLNGSGYPITSVKQFQIINGPGLRQRSLLSQRHGLSGFAQQPLFNSGYRTRHHGSLYNHGRQSRWERPLVGTHSQGNGNGVRTAQSPDDEPEVAILVMACAIGLATGAGVVLFNDAIHAMRHVVWAGTPLEATFWGRWARQLDMTTAWPIIVFPPTIGGLLVGTLRRLSGGLDDPPHMPAQSEPKPVAKVEKGGLGNVLDNVVTAALATYDEPETARVGPMAGTASAQKKAVAEASLSRENAVEMRNRAVKKVVAPFLRALAAAVTLGTGASLGPEGPSVDIGRSVAKRLGTLLRSQQRRLIPLLAAGSGAGVAAGFNAPISGVFFAVETVLTKDTGDGEGKNGWNSSGLTVAMVLLASVLAAIVSQAGLGVAPAFKVPDYELQSLYELPLVLVLGSLCGLVSATFSLSNKATSNVFSRVTAAGIPDYALPALGGLATGIAAVFYPEVLYQGFGNVNAILSSGSLEYAPGLLLQLLAIKIVTTSLCRGSGLVGGIYAPSIFMGAALGSAFGSLAKIVCLPLGLAVTQPQAYALVGVAAMLAANCQVPLTAVLLLFELTRDYSIIIPTLGAVGVSYWIASIVPLEGVAAQPLLPFASDVPNSEEPSQLMRTRLFGTLPLPSSDPTSPPPLAPEVFVLPEEPRAVSAVSVEALNGATLSGVIVANPSPATQQSQGASTNGAVARVAESTNGAAATGSRNLTNGAVSGSGDSANGAVSGFGTAGGHDVPVADFLTGAAALGSTPGRAAALNGINGAAAVNGVNGAGGEGNPPVPLSGAYQVANGVSEGLLVPTVLSAAEQNWVFVQPEMRLPDVLYMMEEASVPFALVQGRDGVVRGVLTREAAVKALAAAQQDLAQGALDACALEQSIEACLVGERTSSP